MSTVAPSPAAVPRPASRSRLRGLLRSSIGLKIIMAVTGVILSGYVLVHMAGNLQVFQGKEAIDAYARFLRVEPALLWLLAAVALHIWAYLVLTRQNQRARAEGYRVTAHKESSYASRSMRLTGPLLLLFIIYHILHLTTGNVPLTIGAVHSDFAQEGKVYDNLTAAFSSWPVVLVYLLGLAALAFHLWHGIWSMFQTLGVGQARYRSFGRRFATIFALLVVLGFAAVPLTILARNL